MRAGAQGLGLYELTRAEGVMIEGVDGRELPFPKRLLREGTKRCYNALLFGCTIKRERSIDPIHSASLLLVCLPILPKYKSRFKTSRSIKLCVDISRNLPKRT